MSLTRSDVVAAARTWIGTPWQHQQRTKGVAVDCVGLVIGVGRELGMVTGDWDIKGYGRHPDGRLLAMADEHMQRIALCDMRPGDVIGVVLDAEPQHFAILGDYLHGGLSIIHAAANARPPRVIETRLMPSRALRVVAAWALPGVA